MIYKGKNKTIMVQSEEMDLPEKAAHLIYCKMHAYAGFKQFFKSVFEFYKGLYLV